MEARASWETLFKSPSEPLPRLHMCHRDVPDDLKPGPALQSSKLKPTTPHPFPLKTSTTASLTGESHDNLRIRMSCSTRPLTSLRLRALAVRRAWTAAGSLGSQTTTRALTTTAPRRTDGVFRGLTDERLPMPWIEAFKKQQAGEETASSQAQPKERDLSPRKMSDSYHRVVLPLGQDPWLSDLYLNSSGHIR